LQFARSQKYLGTLPTNSPTRDYVPLLNQLVIVQKIKYFSATA